MTDASISSFVRLLGVNPRWQRVRQGCARKMVYTRKRTVPYPAPRPVLFKNLQSLSCQRSQPTINPSGRARWSGGAFRAPWYAFQFLGPCGPTKPTNRNKARESDAEQICLLTCFAGHPSLISVSPSILRLPTIGKHTSQSAVQVEEIIKTHRLACVHRFRYTRSRSVARHSPRVSKYYFKDVAAFFIGRAKSLCS